MSEKILVVEDEPALQETLVYSLLKQGYTVKSALDGEQAIQAARDFQPDLIILDIMLPVFDGFEVCRILRQEMNTPILMLTARDDEIDRVIGLELGADDYITKPFSMRELMARVKAQLRRVRLIREERESDDALGKETVRFGNLTLDLTRREVLLDDRDVRPGFMFADMELIGIPHRIVIGERGLNEGKLEYKSRHDAEPTLVDQGDIIELITGKLCAG